MPRSTVYVYAALLAAAVAWPGHAAAQAAAPAAAIAEAPMSEGEVRRIDAEAGKLTLRHGEIKNLDMPPMTMNFRLADRAWLEALKVGDRIRFRAERSADGGFVVTAVEALK